MALFKAFGSDVAIGESGYDPHKLSSPQVFLLSMLIFLAIVGLHRRDPLPADLASPSPPIPASTA